MQSHLDQGCERCQELSETWRKVIETTRREPACRPPEGAVRAVKAAFTPEKRWGWLRQMARMAQLIFDTTREPAVAAVRGSTSSARQLMHRAEPFIIDLRLESEPLQKRISLIGQVLNSKDTKKEVKGVEVVLLSGERLLAKTAANSSGEFALKFEKEEDLRLFINIEGHRAIGIVLPESEAM